MSYKRTRIKALKREHKKWKKLFSTNFLRIFPILSLYFFHPLDWLTLLRKLIEKNRFQLLLRLCLFMVDYVTNIDCSSSYFLFARVWGKGKIFYFFFHNSFKRQNNEILFKKKIWKDLKLGRSRRSLFMRLTLYWFTEGINFFYQIFDLSN